MIFATILLLSLSDARHFLWAGRIAYGLQVLVQFPALEAEVAITKQARVCT